MKKFLAFLITVILLSGVTYLVVGNNFLLLNFIWQDENRAMRTFNEALEEYDNATSYDLTMTLNGTEGENWQTQNVSIKAIPSTGADSGSFIIINKTESKISGVEATTEESYYYKDGKLYSNTTEGKTVAELTYSLALEDACDNYHLAFLTPSNWFEDFNVLDYTFSVGFAASFSPFYLGQTYNFHAENTSYCVTYRFTMDALNNYRGASYTMTDITNDASYTMGTVINSVNQNLSVSFPTDLDTYGTSV